MESPSVLPLVESESLGIVVSTSGSGMLVSIVGSVVGAVVACVVGAVVVAVVGAVVVIVGLLVVGTVVSLLDPPLQAARDRVMTIIIVSIP